MEKTTLKFQDELIDKAYRAFVDRQCEELLGEEFSNGSILHAWYIFKKILERARKTQQRVSLVAGHLRRDFYGSLLKDFEAILDAGIPVRAVVVEEIDGGKEENEFAQLLRQHKNGTLYQVEDGGDEFPLPHLIICEDGSAYRLEHDHERSRAIVAFGSEEVGKAVVSAINRILPAT